MMNDMAKSSAKENLTPFSTIDPQRDEIGLRIFNRGLHFFLKGAKAIVDNQGALNARLREMLHPAFKLCFRRFFLSHQGASEMVAFDDNTHLRIRPWRKDRLVVEEEDLHVSSLRPLHQ